MSSTQPESPHGYTGQYLIGLNVPYDLGIWFLIHRHEWCKWVVPHFTPLHTQPPFWQAAITASQGDKFEPSSFYNHLCDLLLSPIEAEAAISWIRDELRPAIERKQLIYTLEEYPSDIAVSIWERIWQDQQLKAAYQQVEAIEAASRSMERIADVILQTTRIPSPFAKALDTDRHRNAELLLNDQLPPLTWIVKDLLPAGFFILTGRSKLGKSWLAQHLAISVATGSNAFLHPDFQVYEPARVIYYHLEGTNRRAQSRLRAFADLIGQAKINTEDIKRLTYYFQLDPLDAGGFAQIEADIEARKPALVVIDMLTQILPQNSANRTSDGGYLEKSKVFSAMREFTARFPNITLLGVMHSGKGSFDDPFSDLIGSTGQAGSCDGILAYRRNRGEDSFELHVGGNDLESRCILVDNPIKNIAHFSCIDPNHVDIGRSPKEGLIDQIVRILKDDQRDLSVDEIAEELQAKRDSIKRICNRAVDRNILQKIKNNGSIPTYRLL